MARLSKQLTQNKQEDLLLCNIFFVHNILSFRHFGSESKFLNLDTHSLIN